MPAAAFAFHTIENRDARLAAEDQRREGLGWPVATLVRTYAPGPPAFDQQQLIRSATKPWMLDLKPRRPWG